MDKLFLESLREKELSSNFNEELRRVLSDIKISGDSESLKRGKECFKKYFYTYYRDK